MPMHKTSKAMVTDLIRSFGETTCRETEHAYQGFYWHSNSRHHHDNNSRIPVYEGSAKQVQGIMANMKCQKDFKCHASDFKDLCRAKDLGLNEYVECLQGGARTCEFRHSNKTV